MKIIKTRLVCAWILLPLFLIHIFLYFFHQNRKKIQSDMPTLTQFIYHLIYDKPYRNVFYYRVGRIHFLFSWLLPRCYYTKINQNMNIGHDIQMEHAFNTFLNAKSILGVFTMLLLVKKMGKLQL